MSDRSGLHVSSDQVDSLISYMESHSLFARGQIMSLGPSGHDKYKRMWNELTCELNLIGPVQKSIDGWTNFWKSIKGQAKRNKRKYLFDLSQTGNTSVDPLSELDERITAIFGDFGVGCGVIPESGFVNTSMIKDSGIDDKEIDLQESNLNDVLKMCLIIQKEALNEFLLTKNNLLRMLHVIRSTCQKRMSSKNRPSKQQMSFLISWMERKTDFARRLIPDEQIDAMWEDLVFSLNNLSTESRSVAAWKKTWDDQVNLVKKRKNLFILKKGLLSESDKKILKIVEDRVPTEEDQIKNTSTVLTSGPAPKRLRSDCGIADSIECMDEQNDIINTMSTNIVTALEDLTTVMRDGFKEINSNIKALISVLMPIYADDNVNNVLDIPDEDSS